MNTAKLQSYAKINVGLRILRKREDGFHDLETIFYPINLCDEVRIEIRRSNKNINSVILSSNKPFIPLTKDNLCYKAVEYFFREFRIRECYELNIFIDKKIPVGGGLGGGSSNAASIIKFLIKFMNIDIGSNKEKILNLALSIGSDVTFFLLMKPCYAGSRGERMISLKNFKIDYDILIVNPNLHISTKWAFERLNFKKGYFKEPVLNEVKNFKPEIFSLLENDFERVVFNRYSEMKTIKDELIEMGAVFSSMSGSGATMYAFFPKNKKGTLRKCREYYNSKNYFTFVSD